MLRLAPSFSCLLPAPVLLSVLLPPAPSRSHQAGIYFCVSASAAFHSRCTWWEDPDNNGDHCDEPRSHRQPHAQESQDHQEESAWTGQATATGRLLRVGLLSFWPLLRPLVSLFRKVSVCLPLPFSLCLLLFTWCVIFFPKWDDCFALCKMIILINLLCMKFRGGRKLQKSLMIILRKLNWWLNTVVKQKIFVVVEFLVCTRVFCVRSARLFLSFQARREWPQWQPWYQHIRVTQVCIPGLRKEHSWQAGELPVHGGP